LKEACIVYFSAISPRGESEDNHRAPNKANRFTFLTLQTVDSLRPYYSRATCMSLAGLIVQKPVLTYATTNPTRRDLASNPDFPGQSRRLTT
jgi:hypothetical protein